MLSQAQRPYYRYYSRRRTFKLSCPWRDRETRIAGSLDTKTDLSCAYQPARGLLQRLVGHTGRWMPPVHIFDRPRLGRLFIAPVMLLPASEVLAAWHEQVSAGVPDRWKALDTPRHCCRCPDDGPKTHVSPFHAAPLLAATLMPHPPYTPSQEARYLGG